VDVDRGLVERARKGDREAFAQLVPIICDRLFATAYRILRDIDSAGDAYQLALVSIWRELPMLRDVDRFEAWASRVLIRHCYAELRRRRRQPLALDLNASDEPSADETLSISLRDQLERAFVRLTSEQKAVLVLMYYRDFSIAEIASQLGISTGTVKSRLHYARQALRGAVEADARTPIQEGRPA
jgi:RNA polymerase sigma-70 factor, ECF subfamily